MFILKEELAKCSNEDLKTMYEELQGLSKNGYLEDGKTKKMYNEYKTKNNITEPVIWVLEAAVYKEMADRYYKHINF